MDRSHEEVPDDCQYTIRRVCILGLVLSSGASCQARCITPTISQSLIASSAFPYFSSKILFCYDEPSFVLL
jgi:hypothetical protein